MAHYNRYDTALITLYALGKNDLVPIHLRELVPHSTASEWRKLRVNELVGHELRTMHQEALDMQAILASRARLKRTVRVLVKVWAGEGVGWSERCGTATRAYVQGLERTRGECCPTALHRHAPETGLSVDRSVSFGVP